MGRSKIIDEDEVLQWFEEGRTYNWMQAEYRRKYNIETVHSMWGNFRRRRGLPRRISRSDELIPWLVREEHRWAYPLAMLRVEGRRREGRPLRSVDQQRLQSFIRDLHERNVVVHYDPSTEAGFSLVPRRLGVDLDFVRVPDQITRMGAHDDVRFESHATV